MLVGRCHIQMAVLYYYLSNTKKPELARVACETMVTTNKVFIAGEVRGDGDLSEVNKEHIEQIMSTKLNKILFHHI